MEEIWKDIPNYENLYQVSSLGNIRSLYKWDVNKGYIKMTKNKKIRKDKDGYMIVDLIKNKKSKTYKVHRLVALAFIDNPNNLSFVNHKNEIKNDNKVENLEWCTNEYNINYGTARIRAGIKHRKAVIQYDKKGLFIKKYNSITDASNQTGLNISNISATCKNIQKSCGGYIWKFC